MSSPPAINSPLLAPLRKSLSRIAQVLLPEDANYGSAIKSWNLDLDCRPPLVLQPASTADVAACINFLRENALPFTVAGGMHSNFGKRDGYVLLSLSLMRSVNVDQAARLVRVQGGALNADVDQACSVVHMYCPTGTYPGIGMGGLVLGGGMGFLSRRQGLSLDCLQEVELVTADGRVVRANEKEQSDLFWAVRGAGYNFGVATEFVLRVQPVGHRPRTLTPSDEAVTNVHRLPAQEELEYKVVRGILPYPQSHFEPLASSLQTHYIGPGRDGPLGDRDLYIAVVLGNGPRGPATTVLFVHTGDVFQAYTALDELVAFLGPPLKPVSETVQLDTYVGLQSFLAPFQGPGNHYDRGFIALQFSPELAAATQESFSSLAQYPGMEKTAFTFVLAGAQSAISDHIGETAFSDEQRRGNVWHFVHGRGEDNVSRGKAMECCKKCHQRILPHCHTPWSNASNGHASSSAVYGTSLRRLRQVKQQWDPTNLFCNNENVLPANMDGSGNENVQLT